MRTEQWTEEELAAYAEAMRQGKYLTGLDIMLKAQARIEGRPTHDDSVYAPIMDGIFGKRTPPAAEGGS